MNRLPYCQSLECTAFLVSRNTFGIHQRFHALQPKLVLFLFQGGNWSYNKMHGELDMSVCPAPIESNRIESKM